MAYINRRRFLNSISALGMASGVSAIGALGASKARAADISGYKALVMLFFKGGQDGADFLIPYDTASWNALRNIRQDLSADYDVDNPNSPRNRNNLLPLTPDNGASLSGRQYAFPPELSPLDQFFADGDLAVIGNVGPLIEPVTRDQMDNDTAVLPARLFSHNDQQSTWMTFASEGARLGWGGRFADASSAGQSGAAVAFAAVSAGSNDPFLSGESVQPIQVSSSGAPQLNVMSRFKYLGNSANDQATDARLQQMLLRSDYGFDNYFLQDLAAMTAQSTARIETLSDALDSAIPMATTFPGDSLGKQLKAVADMINVQEVLGAPRQVFYVTIGGYDSHRDQAATLPGKHAVVAAALSAFREAMIEIGKWDDTLLVTASDFGRTYIDNGSGTDHGWGSYHVAMGGNVIGRNFYGGFPEIDVESQRFTPTRGRLIPDLSVEQYAAPMGRWFGLTNDELNVALPGLGAFDANAANFI